MKQKKHFNEIIFDSRGPYMTSASVPHAVAKLVGDVSSEASLGYTNIIAINYINLNITTA